jgi:predicted TIM-barrel fold metal-dependent hydrolase
MDVAGHNDWMAAQVAGDPASGANMLVTPDMRPEYVAEQVKRHDFFGLKPYRLFAPDPTHARIGDFLPEALIEVAHDMGLAITMHLSKQTGPADPENLADLRDYTRRYPKARWILAHCARAFNAFMLEESIQALKDIPNLWYDTSAINDLYSHYLLMKHEDRGRVMFGSDNIAVGCVRGTFVTYGRAWFTHGGDPGLTHCDATPTFIVYEQLRQERRAADMLGLTRGEIEDHFSGNAKRFIALVRGERRSL